MTDTDLHQPGLGPLRAAAGAALGGACLLAVPAGLSDARAGIAVSWTAHSLLLVDWDRYGTHTGTQQAMNAALGSVLRAFGCPLTPFGSGGAWLVTGHRGTEAGR